MRASVVVPTFRRPESLARCLDALERQEAAAAEILVVIRRDDEASRASIGERSSPNLRSILIDVPSGRPGFLAALNAGVAESAGDVVCFTDDDAEPHPDWISRILAVFASDPAIGAVGGRDFAFENGVLDQGTADRVGLVTWWGGRVGDHHRGVGPQRDVDVLKGVNLSVRGVPMREIGFDRRLLGQSTEHHSEIGLCLTLKRHGFRIVYDPAIAVDHRMTPRVAENREFDARQVRDGVHNETLALLECLSATGKALHLAFSLLVGSRAAPGLAQSIRLKLTTGDAHLLMLGGNMKGRLMAIATHRRTRGEERVTQASVPLHRLQKILAIPHSAPAYIRAVQLLGDAPGAHVLEPTPGARGALAAVRAVLSARPDVLYLVDVGKSTAPASVAGRLLGIRVVVDTGDAGFALARSVGGRGFLGLLAVGLVEQLALRSANEIIVRGLIHREYVPGAATHIPDIAPPNSGPVQGSELREKLGLEQAFVVGLVGSLNLSPRRQTSYGWDLIEMLAQTDSSVVALIVGDGSGRPVLEGRAEALGVAGRCRFLGRVPSEEVAEYVCAMDVALSTQTNDVVGRVRTTGKLPLYLACERPVIASHVGEAARLLGPFGWTVPYKGVVDRSYPSRLAEAVEEWRNDPGGSPARRKLAGQLANAEFDADLQRARLLAVLEAKP